MPSSFQGQAGPSRSPGGRDGPYVAGASRATVDPHDFAHGIIEGAFSLIFPDPQARRQLGLKAISRAGHGAMAWYIWTAERAGAYEIALVPELPDDVTEGALLVLRYFPDPGESPFRASPRSSRRFVGPRCSIGPARRRSDRPRRWTPRCSASAGSS